MVESHSGEHGEVKALTRKQARIDREQLNLRP